MTLTLIVITGLQLSDSSIAIRVQGARLHVDLKDKVFAFHGVILCYRYCRGW